jgi:bifunctional polynucleotide phosphatase/kinase
MVRAVLLVSLAILYVCLCRTTLADNTNRDIQTRRRYIEAAKKLNVPVRCVHNDILRIAKQTKPRCFLFTGTMELAWHNNLYRAYNLPPSVAAREVTPSLCSC